jgi:uncharacterized membrane protein SpoIIM required for sporulation
MLVDDWVRTRSADWKRLAGLLDRVQGGNLRALSEADLAELGDLYRQVTSDLAVARRDYARHQVVVYLNQLLARAHAVVYRGEPLELRRVWRFFAATFPRLYRETGRYTLLATLLFILPALLSFALTWANPDVAYTLLPADSQGIIPLVEEGEMWTDVPEQMRSVASSSIMTNNIQVAFLAFAGGVLFGLLTVYVLVFNGLLLGTVAGLCQAHGLSLALWSFVLPHGVIELSVIFLAGGSGLMLGQALLSPGLLRRRDALAAAARKAVRLVFGCVPLLVVAGTIEGFVSPSALPAGAKITVGVLSGVLLYGYLLGAGRPRRRRPVRRFIRRLARRSGL